MDGTPRRRSTGAGSRGHHAQRRRGRHAQARQWVPTGFIRQPSTHESPTDVGEAAVAADGLGAASADREAAVEPDDGGGGILPNPSDGSGDPSAVAAVGGEDADATDLQRVQERVDLPCPLGEADGTDDDGSDGETSGTMTVSQFQPGDSVWEKSDGSNVVSDEDDEGAAVAAHDAQPTETHRLTRSTREPRKIAPEDATLQWKWAQRNDADHVGNIGWLFGNFGSRAENPKMRDHIDELLKKQPAMVIGLAECQLETEELLQREPAAVAANATSGARRRFKDRPEFSYLTWRGNEDKSVLIGVRNQAGCSIQMLNCEIYDAGRTRRKKARTTEKEASHTLAASSRRSPCRTRWVSSEESTLPWWCTCTMSSPIWS